MSETKKKKRSTLSWVAEFAGQKKPNYILSVILGQYRTIIVRQVRASATLMQSIFFVRLAK